VLQVAFDRLRKIAEIGRHCDLDALNVEAETHRIDGIMRSAEAIHFDIADGEAGAGLEAFDPRLGFAIERSRRELAHVNRRPQVDSQATETRNARGMLVRHQDRLKSFDLLADRFQSLGQIPQAQAGIYQDACAPGRQQGAIARASAGQYTEFDDVILLESPSIPARPRPLGRATMLFANTTLRYGWK